MVLDFLEQVWPVLAAGLVSLIAALLLFALSVRIRRSSSWLSANDLKRLKLPGTLIIVTGTLYIVSRLQFEDLSKISLQAFEILFIIEIAWLMIRLVAIGRELLMQRYDMDAEDNLRARKVYTQIRVFERIAAVLIIILAVSFILMSFESIRRIGTSLLASAGIAGIIIGVAAQKLLANLLAGFQIAITQPIRIDDVVIMEGEWGKIEEITLTYVVVKIWDQRRLVIPSSQVIDKPFQNWTRSSSDILGTVFIYTDYRMPVEKLREELTRILTGHPLWDGKVNVLQVTDLTEKSMQIRALMSAKDSPRAWDLRVDVREKLIAYMQKEYPEYLPRTRVIVEENK